MNRRTVDYYLGRVTATAHSYLKAHARHGARSPITRASGRAYGKAVEAALGAGADLTDLAAASGMTPPAEVMVVVERGGGSFLEPASVWRRYVELASVRRELAHLGGER